MKNLPKKRFTVLQNYDGGVWKRAHQPFAEFLPMPSFPTPQKAISAAQKLRDWGERDDVAKAIATRISEEHYNPVLKVWEHACYVTP